MIYDGGIQYGFSGVYIRWEVLGYANSGSARLQRRGFVA